MKIVVVGMGYVGLSSALLFAQNYNVVGVDIVQSKIDMINNRISPFDDDEITKFFKNKKLSLVGTLNEALAYENAEYIIIAIPTNYVMEKDGFDTKDIECTIKKIRSYNKKGVIVIKSTIPIGYIEYLQSTIDTGMLLYAPEFLQEGKALYDSLYPSRIVIGGEKDIAEKYKDLMLSCCLSNSIYTVITNYKEAEAIKLFSNAYLAMRISFFNELDIFAEVNDMESKEIIKGVCLDTRIGNFYNNPSFGYGGYCLPKDTKQLLKNYEGINNEIISAIVKSNQIRIAYIANKIISLNPKVVGAYRLSMKKKSDNFRESAIIYVLTKIFEANIKIIIYDKNVKEISCEHFEVTHDIYRLKNISDIILANRVDEYIEDVMYKVYSRDIYNRD